MGNVYFGYTNNSQTTHGSTVFISQEKLFCHNKSSCRSVDVSQSIHGSASTAVQGLWSKTTERPMTQVGIYSTSGAAHITPSSQGKRLTSLPLVCGIWGTAWRLSLKYMGLSVTHGTGETRTAENRSDPYIQCHQSLAGVEGGGRQESEPSCPTHPMPLPGVALLLVAKALQDPFTLQLLSNPFSTYSVEPHCQGSFPQAGFSL